MTTLAATPPPAKRSANLSLSADVLDAAKALRINVSQVCDRHLREVVRQEQARLWQQRKIGVGSKFPRSLFPQGGGSPKRFTHIKATILLK
ncbi:MAG: hypothetical protein E6Q94_07620 [Burkholderiaceae bacterium]|nr:MAG: hypothetical protein E6Q94_07620 [Burkholderiaceae bacterium]